MEESKCNHIAIVQFLLLLLLVILAILFFWEAEKPMRDKVCVERTQMVMPVKITPQDSITMQEYSQRLDSIQNVLEDVRSQYQAEINIGIDRLNAWVGFWLAVLSLILLLAGIKQYLDSRNYEDKWKKIEEEYKKSQEDIDNKRRGMEKDLSCLKKEQELFKNKLRLENTLFNLLRTMSALHDPLMMQESHERKQMVVRYLENTQTLLREYFDNLSNATQTDGDCIVKKKDERLILELIFSNMKFNICRIWTLFSKPGAGVSISDFIQYIETNEKEIKESLAFKKVRGDELIIRLGQLISTLKSESAVAG